MGYRLCCSWLVDNVRTICFPSNDTTQQQTYFALSSRNSLLSFSLFGCYNMEVSIRLLPLTICRIPLLGKFTPSLNGSWKITIFGLACVCSPGVQCVTVVSCGGSNRGHIYTCQVNHQILFVLWPNIIGDIYLLVLCNSFLFDWHL